MKRTKQVAVDIHVYIPPDLLKAIRAMARKNQRSMTGEITVAIKDYIAARRALLVEKNGDRKRVK